jgi:hypothetical protein
MAPVWRDSAFKHGVPREDQVYALLHPNYTAVLPESPARGRIVLFIGHPHAQTGREVEILVHEYPATGEQAEIFHVMELGPQFRRYREEHPNG